MGPTTDGSDGAHSWIPTANACIVCHGNEPMEVVGYAADFAALKAKLIALGALKDSGSTVPGTYPANVAQALWNWKTLEEDKSNGIHNPAYARALLKNSLDGL
jgi:hypothetical protein